MYISLPLAYMVYQNFQSHKEKRTHIFSLDKTSNTEFFTEHILSSLKGHSIPKTAILRQDSLRPYYKILIKQNV